MVSTNANSTKSIQLEFVSDLTTDDIYREFSCIFTELESVTKKGFILPNDLLFRNIPLIQRIATTLCKGGYAEKIDDLNTEHFIHSYG